LVGLGKNRRVSGQGRGGGVGLAGLAQRKLGLMGKGKEAGIGGMGPKAAAGWFTAVMRSEARDAKAGTGRKRGAEITKQPYEDDAPWLKAGGED